MDHFRHEMRSFYHVYDFKMRAREGGATELTPRASYSLEIYHFNMIDERDGDEAGSGVDNFRLDLVARGQIFHHSGGENGERAGIRRGYIVFSVLLPTA